ncbi:MAG: hypothetical protein H8D46_01775, partial [FCB group bacterium]|nr:hypothetical protein [FCB group bacterium]
DIIQMVNVLIYPTNCGDYFVCPDNPYECCSNLHPQSFLNCVMCHTNQYNNTDNPDHSIQEFPTSYCNLCHNPVLGWHNPNWSHRYADQACINCHQPTQGHMSNMGHGGMICTNCHPNLDIVGEVECYNCHMDQYEGTTSPAHLTQVFPPEFCQNCHAAGQYFQPSIFQHDAIDYNVCYTCHQYNYEQTTDPDHQALGLDFDCSLCHTNDGWAGADPHQEPVQACANCHNFNGQGNPLPEIDHNSAVKLGDDIFNCQICHTSTNNWTSINFGNNRHDGTAYQIYFNIYSSRHQGEWGNSCSNNCHVFGDFNTFSCYDNCHAGLHSHNNILDEHCNDSLTNCEDCSGWNGYWNEGPIEFEDGPWNQPGTFYQCYQCHPDGNTSGPCGD